MDLLHLQGPRLRIGQLCSSLHLVKTSIFALAFNYANIINFAKAFVFAVAFDYAFSFSFDLALAFDYAMIIDYTKACNYAFDYVKLIDRQLSTTISGYQHPPPHPLPFTLPLRRCSAHHFDQTR